MEPSAVSAPQGLAPPAGRIAKAPRVAAADLLLVPRPTMMSSEPASQKVMVPSGEPVGTGATVPVRVMVWPATPGIGEIPRVVAVLAAAVIVTVTGSEVESASVSLPL